MSRTLNTEQGIEFNVIEDTLNLFFRVIGRMLTIFIAAFLLAAWAVTGPLFRLSDLYHERFNKKMKETLKGTL